MSLMQAPPPKIVFVCEHGTVKSVVALEEFNRLAKERGLNVRAVSRGTHPDSSIPAPVRAGLKADGFDVSAFRSRLFERRDVQSALLVIALDADVDSVVDGKARVDRWDRLPSVTADYAKGRSAIVARVTHQVDSLATIGRRPKR
jgi:arsenate reductase